MIQYLDSSFLLSMIMGDVNTTQVREIWVRDGHRFSSLLLKIETLTVVRRVFSSHQTRLPENWLEMKEGELKNLWQSIHFRDLDQDIFFILESHQSLSKCRSLDAIHLATALELSPLGGPEDPFVVCSYDKNMIRLALELGLGVLPPRNGG